ncbi:conserved hypothetical protein [Ricinus communis]|uniref:Uncharacterized protein n=1 Tax=Ricinus communis TaxID=3988 RepID=B9SYG5_RICCO|nr:conserved hypothetical protein [Ricinus communis]
MQTASMHANGNSHASPREFHAQTLGVQSGLDKGKSIVTNGVNLGPRELEPSKDMESQC